MVIVDSIQYLISAGAMGIQEGPSMDGVNFLSGVIHFVFMINIRRHTTPPPYVLLVFGRFNVLRKNTVLRKPSYLIHSPIIFH